MTTHIFAGDKRVILLHISIYNEGDKIPLIEYKVYAVDIKEAVALQQEFYTVNCINVREDKIFIDTHIMVDNSYEEGKA